MDPAVFASLVGSDPEPHDSLVRRIYASVRRAAADGRLAPGETIPSSRAAAACLGVSRNTVNAAYDLLSAEGVIEVRRGSAPRIADFAARPTAQRRAAVVLSERGRRSTVILRRGAGDGPLAPGSPDPLLFPADAWGRALRRNARRRQDGAEGYEHYHGLPELRETLADQLRRHRGLAVRPEDVIVTPGTQASMSLVATVLADPGDVAVVETPGYVGARSAFLLAGLSCRGLPVDAEGANVARADLTGARLVYVTPSTQYPTGVRMTLGRRLALLDAARLAGAAIVEDDYDSEFVWRGRGVAAMAALPEADHVVYVGSAAKTLLPGLRIGWLAAPAGSGDAFRAAQARLGLSANVHAQAALAEFMADGAYRAHLERVSEAYRERLSILTDAIAARLGETVALSRPDGGLQLTVETPPGVDDQALRARLNRAGFAVGSLSDHRLAEGPGGLIVGFGSATARVSARFAEELARALEDRP